MGMDAYQAQFSLAKYTPKGADAARKKHERRFSHNVFPGRYSANIWLDVMENDRSYDVEDPDSYGRRLCTLEILTSESSREFSLTLADLQAECDELRREIARLRNTVRKMDAQIDAFTQIHVSTLNALNAHGIKIDLQP